MSTSALNIREQLAGLSPAKRSLVELKLLKKKTAAAGPKELISRRPDDVPAQLSYNQQGLWVLSQIMPNTSLYHVPKGVRLTGNLDVSALRRTLNFIVARHEALRTSFVAIEGVPAQIISENLTLDLPLLDLSHLPEPEREAEARRLLREEARRLFDLSKGPLIRASLFRLHEQEHILLVTMHHIVTDGWSMGIFHRELMALYEAFANGKPSPLPGLSIQYADFAHWHRQWFQGGVYESQLSYWKNQFKTLPVVLELPADHPRPFTKTHHVFRGLKRKLTLSKDLTQRLKELCQKEESTLFMVLLAAYQTLLHRYTGEEDIVVGCPIAGRCLAETEQLIGLFVNALPLRVDFSGNPTFRELLARVKDVALGGYAHQDFPFETLVKELQPDRTLSHNPLFQVMFVLQSESISTMDLAGLKVSHVQVDNVAANFDLTLDAVERDGQLECLFESNADLFDNDRITRLLGHFQNLLEGIVVHPQQRISDLPLLSESERHQLLIEWNDTASSYPATSVQRLFEDQVELSPDAVALLSGDRQLTYQELNERANQLAHYLKVKGVGPETRVGVCLERSPEMIIGLLGILKAGGAYVPLDPDYPQARLKFMLEDAEVSLLLTQKTLKENLAGHPAEAICLDELWETIALEKRTNPANETTADSLAYVMYTSGSTGKPKGVAVMHRNIVRLVRNTNYANFTRDEVFLQFAPISFDASTFEIWGSLLNGARLALMPPGVASLDELGRVLERHQVTTLWLTAGLFHLMVDTHLDDLKGLRQLLAGGDVLSVPHVKKALQELKGCRLINGYGPTENTTFTCCFPVADPAALNGSVPIGRAISNTHVYVLDGYLNPAPLGVPGQLYIGGDGLARGYLNSPELTAERFVSDPFGNKPGAQLYKTGDLVRYRPDGAIEFLGRLDGQVKVRGYRIELGEVETVLAEQATVRDAVVVARKDQGDKHLAAYVVPREGKTPIASELRAFLSERLPGHMVPSIFVVLEELPLSANGKIDRNALPAINGDKQGAHKVAAAPQDGLELKVLKIWETVLAVGPIGINDNFFELGGHSLLAVRLFAQIEKAFGRNLPLATLFQAPTVRLLANVLREEGWSAPWSSLVLLQNGGNRRPFFCVHAAGGNVLEYHDLARLVGPDQPFYGLQAQGLDGKQAPHTNIKEMAAHYIKEMREVQPAGPYLIGGRSSGGTIAFEMACQLVADGEQVAFLALLDSYPAGYFKLLPGSGSLVQRAHRLGRKIQSHRENLQQLTAAAKLSYVVSKLRYAPAKIRHKVYRQAYKIYQRIGRPLPSVLKNIEELNFAAVKDYVPQVYPGRATLFLAGDDRTAAYDVEEGWQGLVEGGLEKVAISGNHLDIVKEPHVRTLAEKLRACLDRVHDEPPK